MIFLPDFSCCFSDPDPEPEPPYSAPKPDLAVPISFKAEPIQKSPAVSDLVSRIRMKYPDLKYTVCSFVSMTSTPYVSPVLLKVHQLINDETKNDLIAIIQKCFPSSAVHLLIEKR
jgi:hypothetical protein